MKIIQRIAAVILVSGLAACQSTPGGKDSLYQDLGGQPGIENIVDNFIDDIQQHHTVSSHFEESNMQRFREKFVEQLCNVSGGPCQYSGDTMLQVHQGMNANEADFNKVVEMMIAAMDEANVGVGPRNRLLARLAPMRSEIIYQ